MRQRYSQTIGKIINSSIRQTEERSRTNRGEKTHTVHGGQVVLAVLIPGPLKSSIVKYEEDFDSRHPVLGKLGSNKMGADAYQQVEDKTATGNLVLVTLTGFPKPTIEEWRPIDPELVENVGSFYEMHQDMSKLLGEQAAA